jgi:hypothetical protein
MLLVSVSQHASGASSSFFAQASKASESVTVSYLRVSMKATFSDSGISGMNPAAILANCRPPDLTLSPGIGESPPSPESSLFVNASRSVLNPNRP